MKNDDNNPKVQFIDERLVIGDLQIAFHRTLRIPDDGKNYALPPSLGHFPLKSIQDYRDRVPEKWRDHEGFFFPMYQREAMWLGFQNEKSWKPVALKIGIGKINAVSGEEWNDSLSEGENDYIVAPPQPWLDGINAGDGFIKQFVAMPLGMGYTVEGQVSGKEKFGGIQFVLVEPKEGKFSKPEYTARYGMGDNFGYQEECDDDIMFEMDSEEAEPVMSGAEAGGAEMGLAAGGKMEQNIYPDPHGIDTWDPDNKTVVYIHIVNSMMYRDITGEEPPPTPVSAKLYTQYGYPWFELYDEGMGDVDAPEILQAVKSVKEMDQEKGFTPQQDDTTVDVPKEQVIHYKHKDSI